MKKKIALFILIVASNISYCQLGFCNGSRGNAIFIENFGSGTDFGPALPTGTTSYTYIAGTPNDGQYTLYYKNNLYSSWHDSLDHTFDDAANGVNGKSLIVNASFNPGAFYKRIVTGLCVNTTFEFSAWIMNIYNSASNVCSGTGIPVNVTFEIWDSTETVLLKSGNTGDINGTPNPVWNQYALTFTTLPGQTEVVLKMKNNGVGGCGNDLAIDDISFNSCGDPTAIVSPNVTGNRYEVCEGNVPTSIPLNISISNSTAHVFQWQQSSDSSFWYDIPGETSLNYNAVNINSTQFYRVIVAQDAANLVNSYCYTISETFAIIVIQQPQAPVSSGNQTICSNETIPSLAVSIDSNQAVNWYDAPTNGNLLLSNSVHYLPTVAGIYYAESYIPNLNCISISRTPVELIIKSQPNITQNENDILCENKTLVLDSQTTNVTYLWSTGAITPTITVSAPGIYSVTVTNSDNCSNTKTITVTQNDIPIITSVDCIGSIVTINTALMGDYEYSLDGNSYQNSNVFYNVFGGTLTAYVKEKNHCGFDIHEFLLLKIPAYFTPNNDGYHDYFEIEGIETLPIASIAIFDRFGKLIIELNPSNPRWNGTQNGTLLPSTDYWYKITLLTGKEFKGHFAMKR